MKATWGTCQVSVSSHHPHVEQRLTVLLWLPEVWLHVGCISMSRVVCTEAGVTALCSALPGSALSHNQWPFCLRWWMGEKCSVSMLVHTVSPLLLSSCLCLLFSHSSWAPEGHQLLQCTRALLMSVLKDLHFSMCMCTCTYRLVCARCMICSTSLMECPSYFVTVPCPCGWCWVLLLLSLVCVRGCVCACVCVLSPGQSEEWDPRL